MIKTARAKLCERCNKNKLKVYGDKLCTPCYTAAWSVARDQTRTLDKQTYKPVTYRAMVLHNQKVNR